MRDLPARPIVLGLDVRVLVLEHGPVWIPELIREGEDGSPSNSSQIEQRDEIACRDGPDPSPARSRLD
jgi:hypothetical protein